MCCTDQGWNVEGWATVQIKKYTQEQGSKMNSVTGMKLKTNK